MIPVILVIIGIIYYKFDPTHNVLMPKCPWWLLTHTYCPSCGIQRVLFHILHGHFGIAFRTNPFLTLAVPYAVLAVIGKWYNYKHVFDGLNRVIFHRFVLLAYCVLFFGWWIVRNVLGI